MISRKNKGVILAGAAATLLATSAFIPTLHAEEAVMVKCVGLKGGNGCPGGCPNKGGSKSAIMSKEECIKAGGKPVKIKKSKK